MKVTILTDKASWMHKYLPLLQKEVEVAGHNVNTISDPDKLSKGDVAFFLSCFSIIGTAKLRMNAHNIVVHASDLPQGKGWSPMSWQILEGKYDIPLTLFEACEKVDSGVIYLQTTVSLDGTELVDEWQYKLFVKIKELCLNFLKQLPHVNGREQIGQESFYRRRTPKDSRLDINKTIQEQFNLLRIVDNEAYPAFFEIHGRKYILTVRSAGPAADGLADSRHPDIGRLTGKQENN
jgi:methionyl-tRNA formyltransferase